MNENSTKNRTDRESVESGAGLGSIILLVVTPESRDKARLMVMETAGVLVLVTSPLSIVEVFRLRTKKSGGRVELGSRDWTLCCQPLGELTKTSTPSTPSLHPSSMHVCLFRE